MLIAKTIEWDMGHRVPNHESKCRNLHWHRYRADIILEGDIICEKGISQEWMVIDFSHIKRIANECVDWLLDHGYMFQEGDEIGILATSLGMKTISVPFVPTAENIAAWLFDQLSDKFVDVYNNQMRLHSIKLYETPSSYVIYPS